MRDDNLLVQPGDHTVSELWIRDAADAENRMPPIGRNLIDENYVEKLATWIDGLPTDAGRFSELLLFPNPGNGYVNLRVSDDWSGPFTVNVYARTGQLMYNREHETPSVLIDFSNQVAGVYTLEIFTDSQREVRQFVINR